MPEPPEWKPSYAVRDAIHGMVPISEQERAIIDTREFQRLRNIRQLALTSYAYPGATHSRFEHSIGAMHLMGRILDRLAADERSQALMGPKPAQLKVVARLAALLHDIGHPPLSHSSEGLLPNGTSHEDYSAAIVAQRLCNDIGKAYGPGMDADTLVLLIPGRSALPPYLNALMARTLDVDKLDYLLRDSHHCGVSYGRFDLERILDTIRLVEYKGNVHLAVMDDGLFAVEGFCLARYWMYLQVYFHKTRRVYDHYAGQYLKSILPDGHFPGLTPAELEQYLALDDYWLHAKLLESSKSVSDDEAKQMAVRILLRSHHSEAYCSRPHHKTYMTAIDAAVEELRPELPEGAFVDRANKRSMEYPSFDELKESDMPLLVLRREGSRPEPVIVCSALLGQLVELDIDLVRVYCERSQKDEVRGKCEKAFAQLP